MEFLILIAQAIAIFAALALVFLGIFSASWLVLLILLLVVLIGTQWFINQVFAKEKSLSVNTSNVTESKIELNQITEKSKEENIKKYRGITLSKETQKPLGNTTVNQRTYRGVKINT
jgi:flagellar biosynthesis component FlhA